MDNLHAEKFAIGGNEAAYSYDGSGINPDAELEQPMEELTDEKLTFEDEPIPAETPDGGTATTDKPDIPSEDTEDEGSEYTNILLIGGLLLALLFYKKK